MRNISLGILIDVFVLNPLYIRFNTNLLRGGFLVDYLFRVYLLKLLLFFVEVSSCY